MIEHTRAIGFFGTLARAVVGLVLVSLAWGYFDAQWYSVFLGLVVFPGVALLFQWLWLRTTNSPLHITGGLSHGLIWGIGAALVLIPFTADAAAIFYGVSMLLAAVRGYAGCEILAISNTLLRRNDEIACPVFTPIDNLEARATSST